MNTLEIKDVVKHFESVKALDGVNLEVGQGSITGLLGPNGAGKTTLIRIINNILTPDRGEVRINGQRVSMANTKLLGYLPEERGLYEKMCVEDQILYFGRLKGGDPRRLREVMTEYLNLFELEGQQRRQLRQLSKGNQQKVQIIATLVHEPQFVVLDEPFSGFDPLNGVLLRELVRRLSDKGTSIMLSSHNMEAVEDMCSHIVLINKGKVILDGAIGDLLAANRDGSLIVTTASILQESMLCDNPCVLNVEKLNQSQRRKGYRYRVEKSPGARNNEVLDAVAMQSDVLHFEEQLPSLTDIFIKYTDHVAVNK